MIIAFFAARLAYFTLPWSRSLAACAFLAAVVGFSFGTINFCLCSAYGRRFGPEHSGAIFGMTFAAYGFIAGPLGPALSGFLLDSTGDNFLLIFIYLGVFSILSVFCIRFVVRPNRQ